MHTDRRAEHGSVPHGSRRAARKQKKTVVDLNTSIVKVRIPNLEPPAASLHFLLGRQSGVGKLRWRVIGSLPFRAVHGC